MSALDTLLAGLHWHGHDTFHLDGPPRIWLDPWKVQGRPAPADLVLVSHDHFDHFSAEDVAKLRGPRTVVAGPPVVAEKLPGSVTLRPGERAEVAGVSVEAVPAYNVNKFRAPGQPFHPRSAGHVGYVVTVGGVRLYFAGDTDLVPEMADLRCDVALLPVSGTYVMTLDEALEAARVLAPQVVVPMHYGDIVGGADLGRRFAERWSGRTVVLEPDPSS